MVIHGETIALKYGYPAIERAGITAIAAIDQNYHVMVEGESILIYPDASMVGTGCRVEYRRSNEERDAPTIETVIEKC